MSLLSSSDIDFALQDFSGAAKPNVTFGSQSAWGDLRREPMQELLDGGLHRVGTHITLVLRDGALSGLVEDASIVVDGATFVIRDTGAPMQDGTRILTLAGGPQ